jgi:hypothetical protein
MYFSYSSGSLLLPYCSMKKPLTLPRWESLKWLQFHRKGAVMSNRDGFFAMVSLALGAVALAGVLYTDEFAHGAKVGFGAAVPAQAMLASASAEARK